MGLMKNMKGLGRTILGSNEAIQRGGQKIFNQTDNFIKTASSIAEGKASKSDVNRQFKNLMEDEGFAGQFEGKANKDIDKAQSVSKWYQDNKEMYDGDRASQKAAVENMKGKGARENFESLRDVKGKDDTLGGNLATFGSATAGYYRSGSKKTNAIRAGATAGAYMGANFIGRSLTGGSVGYNNQGERDIAGLPFF